MRPPATPVVTVLVGRIGSVSSWLVVNLPWARVHTTSVSLCNVCRISVTKTYVSLCFATEIRRTLPYARFMHSSPGVCMSDVDFRHRRFFNPLTFRWRTPHHGTSEGMAMMSAMSDNRCYKHIIPPRNNRISIYYRSLGDVMAICSRAHATVFTHVFQCPCARVTRILHASDV